jgi:hypothetical protein
VARCSRWKRRPSGNGSGRARADRLPPCPAGSNQRSRVRVARPGAPRGPAASPRKDVGTGRFTRPPPSLVSAQVPRFESFDTVSWGRAEGLSPLVWDQRELPGLLLFPH